MGVSMTDVARAIGADDELVKEEQARIEKRAKLYNCETDDIQFNTPDGTITRTPRTLRLGKRVPEDWAAYLWTENARVQVGEEDSPEQLYVDSVLGEKHAATIGEAIERAFGLGTSAIDPLFGVRSTWLGPRPMLGQVPKLDVTDAYGVIPLNHDKTGVTEVALVSYGKKEVYVREHRSDRIVNRRFEVSGSSLIAAELPDGMEEELRFEIPGFCLIRPAVAASWRVGHPYGVSVLDLAADHIDAADSFFDNFVEDCKLGRKTIFLPDSMIQKVEYTDAGGKTQTRNIPPDPSRKQMYLTLRDPNRATDKSSEMHEFNPTLRVEENRSGINTALTLVGAAVGFGQDYYTFEGTGGVKTAQEVISEHSDLYRMRKKHFLGLSASLEQLARAVLYIGSEYAGQRLDYNAEIRIASDDSVIEDDNSRMERGLMLFQAGAISQRKFLIDYMHLTDEEADAEVSGSAIAIPGLV